MLSKYHLKNIRENIANYKVYKLYFLLSVSIIHILCPRCFAFPSTTVLYFSFLNRADLQKFESHRSNSSTYCMNMFDSDLLTRQ